MEHIKIIVIVPEYQLVKVKKKVKTEGQQQTEGRDEAVNEEKLRQECGKEAKMSSAAPEPPELSRQLQHGKLTNWDF
eukprot:scaffold3255_cov191-Ochromonas_danica.AAC.6